MSVVEQIFRKLFADVGLEGARVLDGMDEADDFYMQEIAQVKLDHWYRGRIVLIDDAGYCPSPISGFGTSLALMSAYVLAEELASCKGDWEEGLRMYEERMTPFVRKAQSLPPELQEL